MATPSFRTQPPVPDSQPLTSRDGNVTHEWFIFFVALFNRTGGPTGDASSILDTLGTTRGGMLARFNDAWDEFVSPLPNHIPVMNPGADVELFSISGLLDLLGAVHGDVLFRGALGWDVLPPVAGGYLQSNGPGFDPSYALAQNAASVALGLTASGTVQGDALILAAQWNEISTVAANTGALLDPLGPGLDNVVVNNGGNPLKVYPPVGGQIDALGANNPYTLAVTKVQQFRQFSATQWYSFQVG